MAFTNCYTVILTVICLTGVHGDYDKRVDDLELLVTTLQDKLDSFETKFNEREIPAPSSGTCGDEWESFLDKKCFKVLNKKASEEEAKAECGQLDSTLITIGSKEEQTFIEGLLKKHNAESNDVWIGLEWMDNGWKWLDGNGVSYENWDENAVKDGSGKCVEMSISGVNVGKWIDDNCLKKYLVACQKSPPSNNYQAEIDSLKDKMAKLEQATIPIGFLYTRLPNQTSPTELWPHLEWEDVTPEYSGLFFRAEGTGSEPFGAIQQSNQSWISQMETHGQNADGETLGYFVHKQMNPKGWTFFNTAVDADAPHYPMYYALSFYTTGGEVRPKNTAIRIYKRIK